MGEPGEANRRWAHTLSGWAIPDAIVAAAAESPYFFDPQVFIEIADEALARADDTPSDAIARDALAADGTVLDVGCGAGAASFRLHPSAVVGVDPSAELLDVFLERAGVALTDGPLCGEASTGFVRYAFATPRAIMEQTVKRMAEALRDR